MTGDGDSAPEPNTAAAAAYGDGDGVNVNIRCSSGSKFAVKIELMSTVGSFKSVISRSCDVPADQQRLIYKGRILKDDQTLHSYGLDADHTVHLVRGFVPPASANNASAANTVTPNSTPSGVGVGSEDVALGGSGLGASAFPGLGLNGLGGSSGLFGAELPQFEQMQQQLTQNPNLMSDMMSSPLFQNLMNNPEIIRNMITSNPQMREIIDRNPELAHVLNDPNTLRQTLETARNPELMREMMRNTDRAMSNIESSPEGFNMLRRMYENVQEPFLNATTMSGSTRNDQGSNPFAALLGNQGGGQARDQSTNPTNTNSESAAGSTVPNSNPLPNPWAAGGTGSAQANATTRSNPAGLSALGGLGSNPEFEGLLGSMPDIASVGQMLQNPAMSQMMQSVLSNPEYMNQILGLNPQMRTMMDSNPQLRDMMGNPDFIRQLTSPETMQQLLTVQQALSQLGRQSSTQEAGPNGGGTGGLDNMGLDMLMSMFGGLGTGNPLIPNQSNVPPEELYAAQLSQLQEMGFFDTGENINALIATAGNVHAAVERLLGNPGQ